MFPDREDAELWARAVGTDYVPAAITLVELTETLSPTLEHNNVMPGVFPTPEDGPALPEHDRFRADLLDTLKRVTAGS